MKAFVTGGAGYIGSHTCKSLKLSGHQVLVYDNLSSGHRDFVKWGDFIHGDIGDTNKLRAAFREYRPDVVLHFAGNIEVGESCANPGKYFRNNLAGTLCLLEAMRDEGIKNIVISSTCAVYGNTDNNKLDENTPIAPANPYAESKFFMERMLLYFERAHKLRWISLRYFNAAGCSGQYEIGELHDPETHLIPRVYLAALGLAPTIKIFGIDYPTADGTCIRDYIHVEDLARAHIMACQYLLDGGQSIALNLGTSHGISVHEIVVMARKITGCDIPVEIAARRPGDLPKLVANSTMAKQILDWKAEKNLEEILTDAWNFIKKSQSFYKKA